MKAVWVEELGREVWIRPGTCDEATLEGVFSDLRYHVPPPDMPVPRSVLDLGANIGLTAAHFKSMWPEAQVVMVEPNPENLALAERNAPGCVALQVAAAASTGIRYLQEEGLSADAYTLSLQGRIVRAYAMSVLAEEPVDFCKMDVEGAEWEILAGDPFDVTYLLVEFHGEPRDYPSILARGLDAMDAAGYESRHHPPHPAAVFGVKR